MFRYYPDVPDADLVSVLAQQLVDYSGPPLTLFDLMWEVLGTPPKNVRSVAKALRIANFSCCRGTDGKYYWFNAATASGYPRPPSRS